MFNKKAVGDKFITVFLVYSEVNNLNKIIDSIKVSWDMENLQITNETEICSTLSMAEQLLFSKGDINTGPWFGKILSIQINQTSVKSETNGLLKLKYDAKIYAIESQKVYETGKKENWRPHFEFHSSEHAMQFIALKADIETAIRNYKNLKADHSQKQQKAIIFRNTIQTYYPAKSLEHIMQQLKFLLKEPSSTHPESATLYKELKSLKERDYTLRSDTRSDLRKDFNEKKMDTTESKEFTGNSKDNSDYNQGSDFQVIQIEAAIKTAEAERNAEEKAEKAAYQNLARLSLLGTSQRSIQQARSVNAAGPTYALMPKMPQNTNSMSTTTTITYKFADDEAYGVPVNIQPSPKSKQINKATQIVKQRDDVTAHETMLSDSENNNNISDQVDNDTSDNRQFLN